MLGYPSLATAVAVALSLGACASGAGQSLGEHGGAGGPSSASRLGPTSEAPQPRAIRAPAPAAFPPSGLQPASARPGNTSVEAARRLFTVADTVTLRAAALCERHVRPHTGMRAWAHPGREAEGIEVFSVAQDGPAARAGLRPGDRILAVGGEPVLPEAGGIRAYSAAIAGALARGGTIAVAYGRQGRHATALIHPALACDYRIVFANSPLVNAVTDGRSVMVMRGLVDTLGNDAALALAVGHELAHSVLGHFQRGQALGHGDPGVDSRASLRQFEREADYVGLYFVALAGYEVSAAIEAARKMATLSLEEDDGSATHPSQAERYAALARAAEEIARKRQAGVPLRPDLPIGRAAIAAAGLD